MRVFAKLLNRQDQYNRWVSYNIRVLQTLKNFFSPNRRAQIFDARNIGLYIFTVIVLAITWSSVNAVQNNYELQKEISKLRQENEVLRLQNSNTYLQNKYYNTNEYLDFAARQNLGLAAPGEQVLLIPKSVAIKYVDKSLTPQQNADASKSGSDDRPGYIKNLESWRDFLLGRQLLED